MARSPRTPLRCWNCNDEGHLARNCPDPVERAFQYADPDRRSQGRAGSFQGKAADRYGRSSKINYAAINMSSNGDLYVLELSLGGRELLALIDSGASANFINEEAVPDSVEAG